MRDGALWMTEVESASTGSQCPLLLGSSVATKYLAEKWLVINLLIYDLLLLVKFDPRNMKS